jgi:ATP-dependent exoDNAse (exonuclease V) beta subunit
MAHLHIIRASAGSGKTFSLTGQYIGLLLDEPLLYYRHILAVTFTNKATAEMKGRILEELYLLGSGKKSKQLPILMNQTGKSEESIRGKAHALLNVLLHGYSWFKVETIDSFFQGIVRSFTHELGIPGNYSIEIDTNLLLDDAIDGFLDKLGTDKEVIKWLLGYIEGRIDEGKSWLIKKELKSLAYDLFKERLIARMPVLEEKISDSGFINSYKAKLLALVSTFENAISSLAKKGIDEISNSGYSVSDFAYGNNGVAGYLLKLSGKNISIPGKRVYDVLDNIERWATKTAQNRQILVNIGNEKLNPVLRSICGQFDIYSQQYFSARTILNNLGQLGLLSNLASEINMLRKQKEIFLISDAAPFINRIINNNDTPFIYEKVGHRYNHILIDEFQDTSDMQWENFRPLVSNSLSQDFDCLLVGDIKQAIYRWRNSNWEILSHKIKNEFTPQYLSEEVLEFNRRSDSNIINFNNAFFKSVAIQFLGGQENTTTSVIPLIYGNSMQKCPDYKVPGCGYVNIRLFAKSSKKENSGYFGEELIDRINHLLEAGFKPGDMAVLTRSKAEGTTIANFLVASNDTRRFRSGVGVISNESLFLNSSPAVQLMITALKFVLNPGDKIAAATMIARFLQLSDRKVQSGIIFPQGNFTTKMVDAIIGEGFSRQCSGLQIENLYLMVVKLSALFKLENNKEEKVYMHSFFDKVFRYSTKESSGLTAFLSYWEEEGEKQTISAAESENSIRILTIHKSKGLQFPVVLIPFADWSIKPKPGEILWVEPQIEPFNELPLLPVSVKQSLTETIFEDDYSLELQRTIIDNLNLLYVAFTRAEHALCIMSRGDSSENSTIGDLIHQLVGRLSNSEVPGLLFIENEKRYLLSGTLQPDPEPERAHSVPLPDDYFRVELPEISNQRWHGKFLNELVEANPAERGEIMHAILENIRHVKDIKTAVQKYAVQGILNKDESGKIEAMLTRALSDEKVCRWFSGEFTILTEAEIIGVSGTVKRPDRVMIKENNVILVDYKFGKSGYSTNHIAQMKEYMALIKQMNYYDVKGYIWYLSENRLEEILP